MPARAVCKDCCAPLFAGVAQLVEQLICNQQVVGSNPSASSKNNKLGRLGLPPLFCVPLMFHFGGKSALAPSIHRHSRSAPLRAFRVGRCLPARCHCNGVRIGRGRRMSVQAIR
jgi:hypothetical protein